ncbi:hypothetical protein BPJM79_190018 [Bacillus pumilus]
MEENPSDIPVSVVSLNEQALNIALNKVDGEWDEYKLVLILMQSFPLDYDLMDASVQYVCGMSVPPLMMKRIVEQIHKQWFA